MRFGDVIELASLELDAATKFQTDVVKLLNKTLGIQGKYSVFPSLPIPRPFIKETK